MTRVARRHEVGRFLLCLLALALTAAAPFAARPRTWRDATGKFQIEAVYVKSDETTVTLRRTDGKTLTVPIDKLCFSDKVLIKKYARGGDTAAPATARPVSPAKRPIRVGTKVEVKWGTTWYGATILKAESDKWFIHYDEWGESSDEWVTADRIRLRGTTKPIGAVEAPAMPTRAPPTKPVALPDLVDGNTSESREIDLTAEPDEWSLPLDPAPELSITARPVTLGDRHDIDGHAKDILHCPQHGHALVVFARQPPGKDPTAQVAVCDLAEGRLLKRTPMPDGGVLLSVSPSGRRWLARSNKHGFGGQDRLDLYAVESGELKPIVSFKPLDAHDEYGRDVKWARLIDDEHVVVMGSKELAVWELPEAKRLFAAQTSVIDRVWQTQGARQIVVSQEGRLVFVDPLAGKVLAVLPTGRLSTPQLAFRPDGRRLAVWMPGRLQVWDLTTGEMVDEFAVRIRRQGSQLNWAGPDHVLLDGRYLIDVERRVVLWRYEGYRDVPVMFGDRLCFVGERPVAGTVVLGVTEVPHAAARRLAETLPADRLLAVRAGDRVSVEVDVAAYDADRVRSLVQQNLEERGFTVADGQSTRVVATSVTGEMHESTFETVLRPDKTVLKTPEETVRLAIEVGGKTVWKRESTFIPREFTRIPRSMTPQQYLARAKENQILFFRDTWLPKFLTYPPPAEGATAFGSSEVVP